MSANVQTWWTADRLGIAERVLKTYSKICENALQEISDRLGREVTYDMLRNAFRSNGMRAPGAYCGGLPFAPEAAFECDLSGLEDERNVGSYDPNLTNRDDELERILVIPDCHHPYVDRTAWNVMLAAAKAFEPHRIILLGDFGDFYATNRHRKDPNRESQLEHEIGACNRALDQIDALGAKHRHLIFGNHEDNLSRFLADHAPALFNMVKVEALFRLQERGWSWTTYGQHYQCGKVFYAHDPSGCGAYAHVKAGVKYGHPIVHGHTHRASMSYYGNATGEKRVCIMAGWLGDNASATYVHDIGKEHEWMHSFLLGWKEPDGVTHFHMVPVINGKACVLGRMVAA